MSDRQEEERANQQLFATLYAELHKLADRQLRRRQGMDVSPTTLVHETYMSMEGGRGTQLADRAKFLGYAARAMRGLLIDFSRRQQALKRGGGFRITRLSTEVGAELVDSVELQRLSEALDELATLDPRLAELVDLKYFCGFSVAEIAELRQVSERTVKRDWEKARALLHGKMDRSET
jgi:RNA polymerase sigma factor (TIGR02999 family)